MYDNQDELQKALEETRVSGRCIADIARERGLKPQRLYALRYKLKNEVNSNIDARSDITANITTTHAVDIKQDNLKISDEMLTLELNGLRILVGPTVSARRVASIVSALRSEKF